MTSSRNRIIRGAAVEGVKFCTPGGDVDHENPVDRQEKQHLKTLEEYWFNKGKTEGEKQGYERGLKEGEAAGYEKGEQEGAQKGAREAESHAFMVGQHVGGTAGLALLRSKLEQAEKIASQISEEQSRLYEHVRPELVQFSLKVCERLLRRMLLDEETFRDTINMVLEQARSIIGEGGADVYLHPEDYKAMQSLAEQGAFGSGGDRRIHLHPDGAVPRSGCRVDTPMGLVNFDVNRLLDDLEKKVLEVHRDPDDGPEEGLAEGITFNSSSESATETSTNPS